MCELGCFICKPLFPTIWIALDKTQNTLFLLFLHRKTHSPVFLPQFKSFHTRFESRVWGTLKIYLRVLLWMESNVWICWREGMGPLLGRVLSKAVGSGPRRGWPCGIRRVGHLCLTAVYHSHWQGDAVYHWPQGGKWDCPGGDLDTINCGLMNPWQPRTLFSVNQCWWVIATLLHHSSSSIPLWYFRSGKGTTQRWHTLNIPSPGQAQLTMI